MSLLPIGHHDHFAPRLPVHIRQDTADEFADGSEVIVCRSIGQWVAPFRHRHDVGRSFHGAEKNFREMESDKH